MLVAERPGPPWLSCPTREPRMYDWRGAAGRGFGETPEAPFEPRALVEAGIEQRLRFAKLPSRSP